jgi:hypothetical protein
MPSPFFYPYGFCTEYGFSGVPQCSTKNRTLAGQRQPKKTRRNGRAVTLQLVQARSGRKSGERCRSVLIMHTPSAAPIKRALVRFSQHGDVRALVVGLRSSGPVLLLRFWCVLLRQLGNLSWQPGLVRSRLHRRLQPDDCFHGHNLFTFVHFLGNRLAVSGNLDTGADTALLDTSSCGARVPNTSVRRCLTKCSWALRLSITQP